MPVLRPARPELLAPAGSVEALRAAVANGANAVYLGVENFNARRGACNFSMESLAGVCAYAHIRGVRVYLTANVLILPDEMAQALELVDGAWAAGVDAVIVQDLGLLANVVAELPHVRVHASTQVGAHNAATVETLASLGVDRVTLAREVSADEIARLVAATDTEIEAFVHGALCISYSGQCLLSSLIGRRSANRGLCAQPCRMSYELLGDDGEVLATPGAHLLSPKDLAGLGLLPALIRAGVAALKIEGRMKRPEYVALVTGVYRSALDRALAHGEDFEVRDGERDVLAESFSRGFSEAYLLAERGNEMMSFQRPNNRGVPVGRVRALDGELAEIALDTALESDDTIEFWTSNGRFAQRAGKLVHAGEESDTAPAGARARVRLERPVAVGDRVFRVRNAALDQAARRSFRSPESGPPVGLDFSVRLVVGFPLEIAVRDASGCSATARGSVVEPARTKAITAEEVAEHVGRLGGTPYATRSWELELSSDAGIGFSELHRVRRAVLEAYEERLLSPWSARRRAGAVPASLPTLSKRPKRSAALVVRASDPTVASACLEAGADMAMVPIDALAPSDATGLVPILPRVVHDCEVEAAIDWVREGSPVVVGNLGLVRLAADKGARVAADWPLNAINAHSVGALARLGASFVWLSPELSGRQLADLAKNAGVDVGIGVWGRQELMVTEHCVLMAEGPCDRRCGHCSRRVAHRALRDRKGYEFTVRTDVRGRSHLYNAVPLDLASEITEIVHAGFSAVRLDLELADRDFALRQTRRFRALLDDASRGVQTKVGGSRGETTSGHYYRGLL